MDSMGFSETWSEIKQGLTYIAHEPRVREPEQVELVVARPAFNPGTPSRKRRGEFHEIVPGGVGMRRLHV